MKLQHFHILLISLLFTLLSFSLTSSGATSSEPVKDITGHPVIPEQQYYILPVIRGQGGGLTMAQQNQSCPLYVAQENMEVELGFPLLFHSVNSDDKKIYLQTDLNIEFDALTICVQSTVWQLGNVEGDSGQRFVLTGGIKGNPGLETVSNWFRIEKLGSQEYKIVFCPSVCQICKVVCGDVGVVSTDGKRLLGLSDAPLAVVFKRNDEVLRGF